MSQYVYIPVTTTPPPQPIVPGADAAVTTAPMDRDPIDTMARPDRLLQNRLLPVIMNVMHTEPIETPATADQFGAPIQPGVWVQMVPISIHQKRKLEMSVHVVVMEVVQEKFNLYSFVPIGGPHYVEAAQVYSSGAEAGMVFSPGVDESGNDPAGQIYSPGAETGDIKPSP